MMIAKTVNDLIEVLKNLPGDARVYVEGYEEGYDIITDFKVIPIKKQSELYPPCIGEYTEAKSGKAAVCIIGNRGR
jgi:hypothetical protein